MVFQQDADLTTIRNFSLGVYWLVPIMSFSILVGLAMDYDIFLMLRVRTDVRLYVQYDRPRITYRTVRLKSACSENGMRYVTKSFL